MTLDPSNDLGFYLNLNNNQLEYITIDENAFRIDSNGAYAHRGPFYLRKK